MVKPQMCSFNKCVGQTTTLPCQWLLLTDTNVPFFLTDICNVHYNVIVKCLNWPNIYLIQAQIHTTQSFLRCHLLFLFLLWFVFVVFFCWDIASVFWIVIALYWRKLWIFLTNASIYREGLTAMEERWLACQFGCDWLFVYGSHLKGHRFSNAFDIQSYILCL